MGYYTRFTGNVTGPRELLDKFVEDAESDVESGSEWFTLQDWVDEFSMSDSMSWYDHEEETQTLSGRYPHLLFTLYGEGEENEDMWVLYARNGKVKKVHAEVVYPTVDVDTELPSPDVEKALQKIRQKKKSEIHKQIAALNKELEKL